MGAETLYITVSLYFSVGRENKTNVSFCFVSICWMDLVNGSQNLSYLSYKCLAVWLYRLSECFLEWLKRLQKSIVINTKQCSFSIWDQWSASILYIHTYIHMTMKQSCLPAAVCHKRCTSICALTSVELTSLRERHLGPLTLGAGRVLDCV